MSVADEQIIITIPLFLKKLWKMVNDENAEDIIGWNPAGDGFIIYDQLRFITELLPQYFKHNNLASFVRQLNFYDFHKIANTLKNELEFAHPYFLKDLPETLGFITRKCPNLKSKTTSVDKKEEFNEILNGVKELKSKHHIVESELQLLKQENASLWNEINSLRIKYSRQTKIINKLIHFLITYIHSHPNAFSKQNTSVSKKSGTKNINNSPQLLQIDYLNSTKPSKSQQSVINDPSSSRTVTIQKFPRVDIENLLHETEEFPGNYTVSYPTQEEIQYNIENPIEEISDCNPQLEESTNYIVKFPKTKAKKLKQSQTEPASTQPVKKSVENKGKKFLLKRKILKQPDESNSKLYKLSQEANISAKDNLIGHMETSKMSSNLNTSQTSINENMSPLIQDFKNPAIFDTADLKNSPLFDTFELKNSPIFDASDINISTENDNIKTVPLPSKDMIKFNILENPKENLGIFLDNTQLQLGQLQDILNNMNAKEILDLQDCFNLSDHNCETSDSEANNLNLISQELEEELSTLPSVSNFGTEEKK